MGNRFFQKDIDTERFEYYTLYQKHSVSLEAIMRRKDESKKPIISDFINAFYYEHDKVPSVREIVEGTGISLSTVHR